jgi:hypothetical protein
MTLALDFIFSETSLEKFSFLFFLGNKNLLGDLLIKKSIFQLLMLPTKHLALIKLSQSES